MAVSGWAIGPSCRRASCAAIRGGPYAAGQRFRPRRRFSIGGSGKVPRSPHLRCIPGFAGFYRPLVWHSPLATARIRARLYLFSQTNQSLARVAMNLKPLYDRVVVKPIEADEVSAGGIVIPDNADRKSTRLNSSH